MRVLRATNAITMQLRGCRAAPLSGVGWAVCCVGIKKGHCVPRGGQACGKGAGANQGVLGSTADGHVQVLRGCTG
jgi:hypothetical protein